MSNYSAQICHQAVNHLLQWDPVCLHGDRCEGDGGGLHYGVELPSGGGLLKGEIITHYTLRRLFLINI